MPELISINDAIETLALPRTSLYREVKAGRLRMTKRGTRSFIAKADLEAWLAALPKTGDVKTGDAP